MTDDFIAQTPASPINQLMADRAKAIEAVADAVAKGRKLPPREADAIAQIAHNQLCDLEDAIMEAPAKTLADLAAKASIVGSRSPDNGLEWDDAHICHLVKDVAAFAARHGKGVQL
jgi:hypothetical protein